MDGLSEQLGKQLVVEDLEATAAGDLADGGRVEAVLVVAVPALHKDAAVTHTLCVDLSPDVVEMHAYGAKQSSNTSSRVSFDQSPFSSTFATSRDETINYSLTCSTNHRLVRCVPQRLLYI